MNRRHVTHTHVGHKINNLIKHDNIQERNTPAMEFESDIICNIQRNIVELSRLECIKGVQSNLHQQKHNRKNIHAHTHTHTHWHRPTMHCTYTTITIYTVLIIELFCTEGQRDHSCHLRSYLSHLILCCRLWRLIASPLRTRNDSLWTGFIVWTN